MPSSAPVSRSPGSERSIEGPSSDATDSDSEAEVLPDAQAQAAAQTAAGKTLEQVGEALSQAGGANAETAEQGTGSEPPDPLMPEPLDANPSSGSDWADEPNGALEANDSNTAQAEDAGSITTTDADSGATGDAPASELSELEAALQAAGLSLQTAGTLLTEAGQSSEATNSAGGSITSGTDDGLEAALSDASIAVLLVEQALAEAESQGNLTGDEIGQAARLLILANEALITATATLDGTGSTDHQGNIMVAGGRGEETRIAEIDAELEASIAIFESDIQAARDAVAETLSGPAGVAVGGPSLADLDEGQPGGLPPSASASTEGTSATEDSIVDEPLTEQAPDATQVASASSIPEDIPSPQGDDIVAKQLREAATFEQDPELRAKLWEEYKRYKEGL